MKFGLTTGCIILGTFCLTLSACHSNTPGSNTQTATTLSQDQLVARGKYLVNTMGCNDCHTPMKMTAMGPIPDSSRFLSGVPQQDSVIPPFNANEIALMKQGAMIGLPLSNAFAGGWGISFPANITSDSTTGIGGWNVTTFINVFRLGKFMGVPTGRPVMPPMPRDAYNNMTDEDLHAIFAYLQTIPAVHNQVPQYIPFDKIPVKK